MYERFGRDETRRLLSVHFPSGSANDWMTDYRANLTQDSDIQDVFEAAIAYIQKKERRIS
jgi:hypothetical protein